MRISFIFQLFLAALKAGYDFLLEYFKFAIYRPENQMLHDLLGCGRGGFGSIESQSFFAGINWTRSA